MKNKSEYERVYDWAKNEIAQGKTQDEIEVYICGPDRTAFDRGAEAYLRELPDTEPTT
jgi:endo-1,4-beta-D-glucanase Y